VNSLLSDEAALLENWLIKVQHKVSKSIAILKAKHAMSEIEKIISELRPNRLEIDRAPRRMRPAEPAEQAGGGPGADGQVSPNVPHCPVLRCPAHHGMVEQVH
jgi:hypothetical protein